ncbi:MAG: hypothetical protein IJY25_02555 [Bacilli bacterium]|nr:hypothetical protein [Bacilli bacterium]
MKKGFIIGLVVGLTIAGVLLVLVNSQIQAILNDNTKVIVKEQVQESKDETSGETVNQQVQEDEDETTGETLDDSANMDWESAYFDIIRSTSDTWDYDAQTKFGFIYLNADDVPELVLGSSSTSILIYSYDMEKKCVYLLTTCQTGARGATAITYVEKENIIINQSGGMLFESEYQEKEGCIGAFGSWGTVIKLNDGLEESWSRLVYVFDENDDSKDIVETDMSKEIEEYLEKEKDFDLIYNKEEAQKEVFNL